MGIPYTSALSDRPDGMGFFYGYLIGDDRRIDVRYEGGEWVAYVASKQIGAKHTKDGAEQLAIDVIKYDACSEPDDV